MFFRKDMAGSFARASAMSSYLLKKGVVVTMMIVMNDVRDCDDLKRKVSQTDNQYYYYYETYRMVFLPRTLHVF
jgi:hypothetical protein